MKITIREVSVETGDDDATVAAALVSAFRNGAATHHTPPAKKMRKIRRSKEQLALPAAPPAPDVSLSPQLTETWQWLVAHDSPGGCKPGQVAAGLQITAHAATWRLNRLIEKAVAWRVKPGYYRAGEG